MVFIGLDGQSLSYLIAGRDKDVVGYVNEYISEGRGVLVSSVSSSELVSVPVASGLDLVPGKVYKIEAPVVSLMNEGDKVNADIYVVVQSRFFKLGAERTPIGDDSVSREKVKK
ncbi:MAG: hypothetical protein NC433_06485 [Clostridiales bacterium]|nr:hypothetical protein [Clostridiales bacterium]